MGSVRNNIINRMVPNILEYPQMGRVLLNQLKCKEWVARCTDYMMESILDAAQRGEKRSK